MADSTINIQEPAAGNVTKKLDAEQLTVGTETVQRERVQVSGASATEVAAVKNTAPTGNEHGLVTRVIPSGVQDVDVVTQPGAANFATNQISVGTTATEIVAARATRRAVLIVNHGTTVVLIGGSGVTTTTGVRLEGVAGAALSIPTTAAIYGIVASGTQTVSYLEVYD